MTLVVPNEGEVQVLGLIVGKVAEEPLHLCLFQNDMTPAETDTIASYTPSGATGYAPVLLSPVSSWSITGGAPATAQYPQQTFSFTGAGSLSGYFLVASAQNKVMWAERFADAPIQVQSGDQVKITPRITAE